jgi:hypothetical protein
MHQIGVRDWSWYIAWCSRYSGHFRLLYGHYFLWRCGKVAESDDGNPLQGQQRLESTTEFCLAATARANVAI